MKVVQPRFFRMNSDEVGTERPPTPCVVNVLEQMACGEARIVPDSLRPRCGSRGRQGRALTTAPVTSEKRHQEDRRSPWPWQMFSLDTEALIRVRPLSLAQS